MLHSSEDGDCDLEFENESNANGYLNILNLRIFSALDFIFWSCSLCTRHTVAYIVNFAVYVWRKFGISMCGKMMKEKENENSNRPLTFVDIKKTLLLMVVVVLLEPY